MDPDVKLRAALLAALTTAEKVAKSSVVIHYVEEFYRITNQIKSAIADIKTK